jgi:hypothetical protein
MQIIYLNIYIDFNASMHIYIYISIPDCGDNLSSLDVPNDCTRIRRNSYKSVAIFADNCTVDIGCVASIKISTVFTNIYNIYPHKIS